MPLNSPSLANRQKLQDRLSEAVLAQNIPLVHKRLAQGANPAAPGGRLLRTPLMDAAACNDLELINLFIPFNDIDAVSINGETATGIFIDQLAMLEIFNAAPSNGRDGLRLLLSSRKATASSPSQSSPLICAAFRWWGNSMGFNDILDDIFSFSGPDPDALHDALLAALSCRGAPGGLRAIELWRRVHDKEAALLPRGPTQETLAHVAARHGQDAFLHEISSLADFNARDSRGRTPLMAACLACPKSIDPKRLCIKIFLDRGCDPRAVDHDGCDALMLFIEGLAEPLDAFLKILTEDTLPPLIQSSNLMARDFLGESALDKARDRRWAPLVQLLERAAANSLPAATSPPLFAQPPRAKLQELLFQAIEHGDISLVKKRLAQGADPRRESEPDTRAVGQGDTPRQTALMAAASERLSDEIIQLLAPLSDLLAVNAENETALSIFLARETISTPSLMSSMRAMFSPDVAKKANNDGRAPLAIVRATVNFWPEVLSLLGPHSDWMALDANGNNILASQRQHGFFPDYKGDLALWSAHPDQAWLASTRNAAGETLAHIAASGCAIALLKSIAPHADFALATAEGITPLMAGCLRGQRLDDVCETLAPWSDCSATDANGCDALMLAIDAIERESDPFCKGIETLVRWADLDARDFLGESALDRAASRGLVKSAAIIRAQQAIFEERSELEAASNCSATANVSKTAARI